jgi:hypothetical protein
MEHSELPLTMMMGCVCAGKYGGDPALPKLREKSLRNRAMRRRKWLERRWRVSQRRNDFLNVQGVNVVVFRSGSRYAYRYKWDGYEPIVEDGKETRKLRPVTYCEYSSRLYDTKDSAKLAVFDELWPVADCMNVTAEDEE